MTTEHEECATRLWDALMVAFRPRAPQVVADFLAEKTVAILRGPDHGARASGPNNIYLLQLKKVE